MEQQNDLAGFNNKTVLVLGGLGFIGSNFMRALFRESPKVNIICFDKETYSGNKNNINDLIMRFEDKGQLTLMKGDVAVKEEIRKPFYEQIDYVINFAAETHVDKSIHVGSLEFINTNVIGVYNILEEVKKKPTIIRYVQVSTDEVYGQLPNPYDIPEDLVETVQFTVEPYQRTIPSREVANWMKFNRNSPFKPNVPYSATKASGDCLCNAYYHTWKVPVVVTHCSNNYGPYQYPEKLVPFWATKVLKGEKIPIYGDGMNIRDWIHVDDHITALGAVMLRGENGKDYLIGANNERNNLEMARSIFEILKPNLSKNITEYVEMIEDRPGHDRRYAIDHSDITKELGWEPRYGRDEFYNKLKETLEWYATHTEWVEEVINRTGVSNPHIDLWKGHNLKNNE